MDGAAKIFSVFRLACPPPLTLPVAGLLTGQRGTVALPVGRPGIGFKELFAMRTLAWLGRVHGKTS